MTVQPAVSGRTLMKKKLWSILCAAVLSSSFAGAVSADRYNQILHERETKYSGFVCREYISEEADGTYSFTPDTSDYEPGCFACEWKGRLSHRAEKEMVLPGSPNWQNVLRFDVRYEAVVTIDGNVIYGLHGWTKDEQAEFYVIDGWGEWRPPGGAAQKGVVTSGGVAYDVYEGVHTVQSSDSGTKTYRQIWSVRQESKIKTGTKNEIAGKICLADHLKEWKRRGLLDNDTAIASCGMFTDAWGITSVLSGSIRFERMDYDVIIQPAPVTTAPLQTTTASAAIATASVPPVSSKTGDANCDGAVDIADAVLILRYAVSDADAEITDQGIRNADADQNGKTDEKDASLIVQFLAKKTTLP